MSFTAGDMTIKGSSDELALEMQLREEKTYQTADESKREINIALRIWKQTLEAENKRVCERTLSTFSLMRSFMKYT
ncbi:hypothetical protein ANCDUO_24252 [Ancylostoma duodenale]|uniref:Uncharacterized protein n=1 Tax=Ancylostoma duodenale TaxID=51022 RepID=A0A0C2FG74_9BILA|nr:hypothetical protein ANCDUO_24252 [Ancylostoma duodenale]